MESAEMVFFGIGTLKVCSGPPRETVMESVLPGAALLTFDKNLFPGRRFFAVDRDDAVARLHTVEMIGGVAGTATTSAGWRRSVS